MFFVGRIMFVFLGRDCNFCSCLGGELVNFVTFVGIAGIVIL